MANTRIYNYKLLLRMNGNNIIETNYYYSPLLLLMSELALLHRRMGGATLRPARPGPTQNFKTIFQMTSLVG